MGRIIRAVITLAIALATTQTIAQKVATTAVAPLTGLWWNASQSGWGMSIAQHGATIFATWYAYDDAGAPKWYLISSCPIVGNSCTGDLYSVSGGTAISAPWNGSALLPAPAGTGTLTFTNNDTGTLAYTINGTAKSVAITRTGFGPVAAPLATDYSDLWWNSDESGWGVAILQQYRTIFATLYTYDANNKPTWYVVDNCPIVGSSCTGTLTRATGGTPPTATWNGANLHVDAVGSITFDFSSATAGTMRYTLNNVSGTRSISRVPFGGEGLAPLAYNDVFDALANAANGGWRGPYIYATDNSPTAKTSCGIGSTNPTRAQIEDIVRRNNGAIDVSTPTKWCGGSGSSYNCLMQFENVTVLEQTSFGLRRLDLFMGGLVANQESWLTWDPNDPIAVKVTSRTRDGSVTPEFCPAQPTPAATAINANWSGYSIKYNADARTASVKPATMSCANQSCTILGEDSATFSLTSATQWMTGAGAPRLAGGTLSNDLQLASMFLCVAPLDENRSFTDCTFFSFKRQP